MQARMGSTRLPGKVLRPIGHLSVLGHVLGRLTLSKHELKLIVATSTQKQDDVIKDFCRSVDVNCFRGDEQDVLDRYYQCAKQYGLKHVVRLTADNPFTDIEELDRLIDLHLQQGFAFTHSFASLPIGVGAEIFAFNALERSWEEGHALHHREHVDEYLIENPDKFKTGVLEVPAVKNKPDLRLTVDTEEDWQKACDLVAQAPDEWLGTEQLIALCSAFA
ncbi:MAG TPA: glycosyltransferase family protein [Methylophilaceae bacterium]|nr:glycosyltransferase family protein [Methylophilaceae bacterium]